MTTEMSINASGRWLMESLLIEVETCRLQSRRAIDVLTDDQA